jgi:uncharacterized membrane protein
MRSLVASFVARPRMLAASLIGLAVALLVPGQHGLVTRSLLGWNVGVWLYLAFIAFTLFRADHGRVRDAAKAHAEGAAAVSTVVVGAAFASIAAIVFELASTKSGGGRALPQVLLTLVTVGGSWLLIPMLFTLNYASVFHRGEHGAGLKFPDDVEHFKPDYMDFLYFSFTIAIAMQTADVAITDRGMRKLVLVHQLVSFVFNTTILALTVNSAAGLF